MKVIDENEEHYIFLSDSCLYIHPFYAFLRAKYKNNHYKNWQTSSKY